MRHEIGAAYHSRILRTCLSLDTWEVKLDSRTHVARTGLLSLDLLDMIHQTCCYLPPLRRCEDRVSSRSLGLTV